MITETVEAHIARLTAERDRLAAQAEFAVNYSNMMSGERDAFCSLATQAERERDAALARAEKYAADLHEEQRLHTEAVARAEAAERDLAQLRTDMQHLSTEDERGHALIDAADGEDPDTSSADTLTDRVERLLEQRTAARAELAQARETIENLGRQVGGLPLLRDVIAERDQLAQAREQLAAETARATVHARTAGEQRIELGEQEAELLQARAQHTEAVRQLERQTGRVAVLHARLSECLQTYDETEWTHEAAYYAFMKGQDAWWVSIRAALSDEDAAVAAFLKEREDRARAEERELVIGAMQRNGLSFATGSAMPHVLDADIQRAIAEREAPLRARVSQLESALASRRDGLTDLLGKQHVLKYAAKMLVDWKDDPGWLKAENRIDSIDRITRTCEEWHTKVVALMHEAAAALASPAPSPATPGEEP